MIATTATNKKVRELLKAVRDGALVPQPAFQRRLVWTAKDKDKFIDSVIKGYPFPEIYLCNGDVDTETGEGNQLLVDGLQRVSTLSEYFGGEASFPHVLAPAYKDLTKEEKERFLEYSVVVRDLGQISKEQVIEVFRRLNSTQYTLRDMEINNAIYDGALKRFCEQMSEDEFFEDHRVFLTRDRKRMGDVAYCLSLLGTMMLGYFNRDSEHENILSRFNESFPDEDHYMNRFRTTLDFIEECGFPSSSRIWKKADFFTAFLEIDEAINIDKLEIDPSDALTRLSQFYSVVDSRQEDPQIAQVYYQSALQASNDRASRLRRSAIISGILAGDAPDAILDRLASAGLI